MRLVLAGLVAFGVLAAGCGAKPITDDDLGARASVLAGPAHHALILGEPQQTRVLEIGRSGAVLTTTVLPPESAGHVALTDGMIIDELAGRVRGRKAGSGQSAWTHPASGRVVASLVTGPDVVVLDEAASLCAIEARSGRIYDCVALPDKAHRIVGAGRLGGATWIWLRRAGAVLAYALKQRCARGGCPARAAAPAWSAPLPADRPAPLRIGDALLVRPEPGVLELRDGRTGALRVTELLPRLGRVLLTDGAMLLSGIRDDGVRFVAGLDGRADALRWLTAWPRPAPEALLAGPGVLRLRGGGREWLLRARDGALLGEVPALESSAANEEFWLGVAGDRAALRTLRAGALTPLPPPPARPAWLRPGVALHYLVTGPSGPPRRLSWTVDALTDDAVRLRFFGEQDPERVQIWNAALLGGALQLCTLPAPGSPPGLVCPTLLLGREPMAQLRAGRAARVGWPGRAPLATRLIGPGLHVAAFRVGDQNEPRMLHLPALRLRAAGREETLEVGAWGAWALLLSATAGQERIVLIGVSVPDAIGLPDPAGSAAAAQASGSANATGAR
ncbi:MAG: hypothetical protein H6747_03410 [Deltaproteobacteria bacterium]|nr:hypothetical protein [Deltaproteobacteria bacterium]